MTVICQNCQTENRDKAMFCRGCAGKLPAFAATGPSALAALGGAPRSERRRAQGTPSTSAPAGRTGFGPPGVRWWFAAVLLLGVTVIALLAWIAMAPERMPSRTVPATAMGTAPSSATATMPAPAAIPVPAAPASAPTASAPLVPLVATDPSRTVPFESALSPGESQVAPQTTGTATASAAAAAPATPAAPSRTTATRTSQRSNAEAGGSGRADPRVGCEQMFFAFAARCEANHCAQAAYARHPRCAVVRQERLRDEARRNLTSGY